MEGRGLKGMFLICWISMAFVFAPLTLTGCSNVGSGWNQDRDEKDDDDIFVYSGGHYYHYRSYTGSMNGATMMFRNPNSTYEPYTGAKHPSSWSSNPAFKPTTSAGSGSVNRKGTSLGESSTHSSFGASSTKGGGIS